jgi:hypothetical protein
LIERVEAVDAFDAMSTTTATFAGHIQYLATISEWLSKQGVDPSWRRATSRRFRRPRRDAP